MSRKKSLFLTIMFLVVVVTIELVSVPIFYYLNKNSFSKEHLYKKYLNKGEEIKVSPHDVTKNAVKGQVLHPYLGFVIDSDFKKTVHDDVITPINNYGFIGDFPDDPNSIKIALMGGSVAHNLFVHSKDVLKNTIEQSKVFKNRKIEIASIALGGMKQPQQLMALNYFFTVGKFFHIVINLDGFNEMALSTCENYDYGIAPFYPRNYAAYTTKAFNAETLYYISEVVRSKVRKFKYGNYLFSSPLRYSHFLLSLWIVFERSEDQKKADYELKFKNALANRGESNTHPAQERGPLLKFNSSKDILLYSANVWKRTSLLMHQICKENYFQYFHFLQPNQYVIGSKVLTDWEMENAYAKKGYCYRDVIEQGYPLLIQLGESLKNQGVNFYDLTQIFKNISTDIYKDNCCHVNLEGNDLLAKKIAKTIINNNLSKK